MESELDCTLSVTSTPIPTSGYSSSSGTTRGRFIKKNRRRNQNRSGPKVSLADRIKHFRENRDSEETSRGASASHAPSDLHSLVSEYRDALSQESDLSAAVLNSISDAKYTNQQINTFFSKSTSPVSHRRVHQGTLRPDGLLTISPDRGNVSRRRIFQENDWSRNQVRSPNIYSPQLGERRWRYSGRYGTPLEQYQEGRNKNYDSKKCVTSPPGSRNGVFLPAVIDTDTVGVTQSISRSTKDDRVFPTIETSNSVNDAPQIQSTNEGSLKPITKSLDSLPAHHPPTHGSDAYLHPSTISGTGYATYPEEHSQTRSTETLEDRHSVSTGPSSWTQSASAVGSQMSRPVGGGRKQGNRYIETIKKELRMRKYQSPSFLMNHWLDVADDSYEKVLSEFSRPASKSVATQTPHSDKGAETHSITELTKHDKIMNEHKQGSETVIIKEKENQDVHSHASAQEPIPSVSSTPLRKRRQVSTESNYKTYSFKAVLFNRSLSLPNMTKCSTQNTDHLRKNYRETDIELLLHQTNSTMTTGKAIVGGVVFPPISQANKEYHRSKDPLPITRTNLGSRQVYLRSNSCGDIVKAVDKMDTSPPSRLIGLYKDLVNLGCFSSDENILKMTLRKRNYQMLDVKVTWRSKVTDEILTLYRDQVAISEKFKYSKDQRTSKQRKAFIYLEDVPIRNIHSISASDKDAKRFTNIPVQNGHKQASCRMPPVYKGNRKCVSKQMYQALYDQTRHHFVPWK